MTAQVSWEEPPPPKKALRDYSLVAQQLRENPGRWARIDSFPHATAAGRMAYVIRTGRTSYWQEPGDFEAASRAVDGQFYVYARYMGDGGHDDE